jgi:hypothetical protein
MTRGAAVVVTVVVGAGLTGCSSDAGTESTAATAAAASSSSDVCASADAFRGSLSSLADVRVVQDGTNALDEVWRTVQGDWAQLADDARGRYSDQVDGVQADADAVRSAVDTAQGDQSAQTLGAVAAAVGVFVRQAGALVDEVSSTC